MNVSQSETCVLIRWTVLMPTWCNAAVFRTLTPASSERRTAAATPRVIGAGRDAFPAPEPAQARRVCPLANHRGLELLTAATGTPSCARVDGVEDGRLALVGSIGSAKRPDQRFADRFEFRPSRREWERRFHDATASCSTPTAVHPGARLLLLRSLAVSLLAACSRTVRRLRPPRAEPSAARLALSEFGLLIPNADFRRNAVSEVLDCLGRRSTPLFGISQHCFPAFCGRRLPLGVRLGCGQPVKFLIAHPLQDGSSAFRVSPFRGGMERAASQRLKAASPVVGLHRPIGDAGYHELAGKLIRRPVLGSDAKEPSILKGRLGHPIADAVRGSRILEGVLRD
jgi:hypothetical protein